MDILELKIHSKLMVQNRAVILEKWLSFENVRKTLENYIDPETFSEKYASHILNYFFDVVDAIRSTRTIPTPTDFINIFLLIYIIINKYLI